MKKTLLILIDGMRPDGLKVCGHPFIKELEAHSYYTYSAQTVMPSVTLPCHMSLFHSVHPDRHGILTNTYVPQVRPINGICEVLKAAQKKCAMFYNWEHLKDLARPGSLFYSNYAGRPLTWDVTNGMLTENAAKTISTLEPDFTFLYLGWTDEAGHAHGWMGPEYIHSISCSLDCVESIVKTLPEDYLVVLTADHGGHERRHGEDIPEDMTIPVFFYNPAFSSTEISEAGIIDIAPTITGYMGVEPDPDWEGKRFELA